MSSRIPATRPWLGAVGVRTLVTDLERGVPFHVHEVPRSAFHRVSDLDGLVVSRGFRAGHGSIGVRPSSYRSVPVHGGRRTSRTRLTLPRERGRCSVRREGRVVVMTQRDAAQAPQVRRAHPAAGPGRASVIAPGKAPTSGSPTRPLTERILDALPGRRLAWMQVWALVPWLNLVVVLGAEAFGWTGVADRSWEVVNRVATSFAILLSLWGAARISDGLGRLRPALAGVVEEELPDVERLFRGLDSIAIPVVLTVTVGLILPLDEALAGEPVGAVIQGLTWLVIGIPMATAVWVYATLQLGLYRLGRGQLTLTEYRGDRTLGLQAIGSLAFTGFWMLLGAFTPLALASSADLPSVVVTVVVLLAGIVLFFLSLRGLHRQMVTLKLRELDRARSLYEEAYRPLAQSPTLEVLQEQVGLLNAAESLEKRAERIQVWPFDEGTFARAVTIASSVVATIIARILLAPTGV